METVQLEINKEVLERLKQEQIVMDIAGSVLLVLVALYENKLSLLDAMDDRSKERRLWIIYKHLERRNLLTTSEKGNQYFQLTKEGKELVEFIKQCELKEKVEITAEKLVPLAQKEITCYDWINEYCELFPIALPGDRVLRHHPEAAVHKMNRFLQKYKYSREEILQATKNYILSQAQSEHQHKYTQDSNNFIFKWAEADHRHSSGLATWCSQLGEAKENFDLTLFDMI